MFLYWGRRGLTQFALEVARAARADSDLAATISLSRQNENIAAFRELGESLFLIDTFSSNIGVLTQSWRIPSLRQQLLTRMRSDRTDVVIDLMPHVWSSLMVPAIQSAGALYVPIVHDAATHPGDYRTRWVKRILDQSLRRADRVLTLSRAVARQLIDTRRVSKDKVVTLFHPDLAYGTPGGRRTDQPGNPFRLMFMGRIMPYKGLSLFLEAVDQLHRDGIMVEVGVFGEGALGEDAERLSAMGAEVVNHWLSDAEIAAILPRFDAVVLSHTEASQSGVAAAAFGAGLPVIATPVGGLVEQVIDGQTGVLASRVDADALSHAMKRLMFDPALYRQIHHVIAGARDERSMARFVSECVALAQRGRGVGRG